MKEKAIYKATIPLKPITKKNSSEIHLNKKTGARFVAPSKQYREYENSAGWFLSKPQRPIDKPVTVVAKFYLPVNYKKIDLCNLLNALDDVLVACGVLLDDCIGIIPSHDGSRAYIDKLNPRTEVAIFPYAE